MGQGPASGKSFEEYQTAETTPASSVISKRAVGVILFWSGPSEPVHTPVILSPGGGVLPPLPPGRSAPLQPNKTSATTTRLRRNNFLTGPSLAAAADLVLCFVIGALPALRESNDRKLVRNS